MAQLKTSNDQVFWGQSPLFGKNNQWVVSVIRSKSETWRVNLFNPGEHMFLYGSNFKAQRKISPRNNPHTKPHEQNKRTISTDNDATMLRYAHRQKKQAETFPDIWSVCDVFHGYDFFSILCCVWKCEMWCCQSTMTEHCTQHTLCTIAAQNVSSVSYRHSSYNIPSRCFVSDLNDIPSREGQQFLGEQQHCQCLLTFPFHCLPGTSIMTISKLKPLYVVVSFCPKKTFVLSAKNFIFYRRFQICMNTRLKITDYGSFDTWDVPHIQWVLHLLRCRVWGWGDKHGHWIESNWTGCSHKSNASKCLRWLGESQGSTVRWWAEQWERRVEYKHPETPHWCPQSSPFISTCHLCLKWHSSESMRMIDWSTWHIKWQPTSDQVVRPPAWVSHLIRNLCKTPMRW